MFTKPLPRFVIAKRLTSGATGFYFNIPTLYRKLGCALSNEPLGTDYIIACGENGEGGRAAALNTLFDEWNTKRKGGQVSASRLAAYGTVDWLFREYKQSKAYLEKVAPRSRPDYERTILLITDIVTKKGDRIGDRRIRSITPVSADKIYDIICKGPRGLRPRQGEKAVALCRRAWRVCASPASKSIRSRRSESLGGCHEAKAHEGKEGRSHARASLRFCLGLHRARTA
jgi:hypothetical protein